jgi:hypothetical protein
VDDAIYTLNIVRPEGVGELVVRLRARADLQEAPEVTIDHRPAALRITCRTWRPTLISRVHAAIDDEVGAEQRERWFKPF